MFGPNYTAGCPSCSMIADGFNGFAVHLADHDVMLWGMSRAPLAKLQAYRKRMGWTFPWSSSLKSDFNSDFSVFFIEEQQRAGGIEYDYRYGNHSMEAKMRRNPCANSLPCAEPMRRPTHAIVRAPKGRNEEGIRWRRHDEYDRT